MIFNTLINHLRQWCVGKAAYYLKRSAEYGGIACVGWQTANELEFKVLTLTDKSFENVEAFRKEISGLTDVHFFPSVEKPENRTAGILIDNINREFRDCLEELLSAEESLTPVDLPYKRVIVGAEAAELKERYRSVWKYVNSAYWYPLTGDAPDGIRNRFYITSDRLRPYLRELDRLIGLPQAHIYCYGENAFFPEHCIETAEPVEYDGCEKICTDKDFSWAIYFSHESTVSFAGAIVPEAQELLLNEKAHWNSFE